MNKTGENNSFFAKTVDELFLHDEALVCEKTVSIIEAVEVMVRNNVGSIIVVEGKKPIGIFTERDLMKKVVSAAMDLKAVSIEKVMTPNPVCIQGSTPLLKIMSAMRLGKFRHLVITDSDGKLRGVVSIKDVLSCITDQINN
jgi:CBS domain-containing protein